MLPRLTGDHGDRLRVALRRAGYDTAVLLPAGLA